MFYVDSLIIFSNKFRKNYSHSLLHHNQQYVYKCFWEKNKILYTYSKT